MTGRESIEVRVSGQGDGRWAADAAALIEEASAEHDIAPRAVSFLTKKLETGRAALALEGDALVGFGYWSEWEGGAYVSHSGLVVRSDRRGTGLGRELKALLFEGSRLRFAAAKVMSLTTSPQVRSMNLRLGFRLCGFDEVTSDEDFWDGCKTCSRYEETRSAGLRCCCEPMVLDPPVEPAE